MGTGEDVSCACKYTPRVNLGGGVYRQELIEKCAAHLKQEQQDIANAAYKRQHLAILQCDDCGEPTGCWVYENDLNGSLFICSRCKLKYPSKEII